MPVNHVIQPGEGISFLCKRYGFSPDRIWNDSGNAELRNKRKDPDILLPGDVVVIPDLESRPVDRETGARHRFRRVGVPAFFRLQIWNDKKPRANEPYTLTVDGKEYQGSTDDEGALSMFVPNDAKTGVLLLGKHKEEFQIAIGMMDPVNETIGLKKRLANMGYLDNDPDSEMNEATRQALSRFQRDAGIPVTGEPDEATLRQIERLHDTTSIMPRPADTDRTASQ